MAKWGPKDPDAIRDYGVDWSADIGDTTISTSTWLLDGDTWAGDADLVKVASSIATGNTATVIRISGGVAGTAYRVTNHVVLSNGEEDDWTEVLRIKER
jgi:hypothetical protein